MKVAIFTADSNGGYPVPAVKGGAVSTLIESLINENNKQKLCDMTIISLYNSAAAKIAREKYPNIHFIWIRVPRLIQLIDKITFDLARRFFKKKKIISYKSTFSLLWYIHISSHFLRQNTFDKVILENNIPLAWIIKLSKYKGQYYYHLHNVPRINAYCREVFDHCTGFLCVSDFVGQKINEKINAIGPIPKNKIKVLYNCIDTRLFNQMLKVDRSRLRKQICEKYNISPNNRIIVFAGRLSREKGIDQLLKAIKDRNDTVVFIVGGLLYGLNLNDPYQKAIHILAEKIKNRVIFTGYIDQKVLPIYYNIADLAVFPSMWDEPAGLTMIEAMACGTPIITTRAGGITEYVDNVACVLNRNKKLSQNISENIDRYFSLSNKKQEEISKAGIRRINEKFSTNQYLKNFLRCLG